MPRNKIDAELAEVFSANLVEQLETKQITQYRLAKELGISSGTVYDYVHKRSLPSLKTLKGIAKYLEVTLETLLD